MHQLQNNIIKKILVYLKKYTIRTSHLSQALIGIKNSKYIKLLEATLYELRLMMVTATLVISLYIVINTIDGSNDPEIVKIFLKLNCILMLLILFLTFRVLIKVNFKYKYYQKNCEIPKKPNSKIKYTKIDVSLHKSNIPQTHAFGEKDV